MSEVFPGGWDLRRGVGSISGTRGGVSEVVTGGLGDSQWAGRLFQMGQVEEGYRMWFRMGGEIEDNSFQVDREIGGSYQFTASGWGGFPDPR